MLVLAIIDDDTSVPPGVTVVAHVFATGSARVRRGLGAEMLDVHDCPVLLDYDETAGYLNVSRRKVERLVKAGELPCVEVGSSRRIDPADLRAYMDRRKNVEVSR